MSSYFEASHSETSSPALIELQYDLINLSQELTLMGDVLKSQVNELGSEWRDQKFDEFESNFREERQELENIAVKYMEWAKNYLQQRIDAAIEIENARSGIK